MYRNLKTCRNSLRICQVCCRTCFYQTLLTFYQRDFDWIWRMYRNLKTCRNSLRICQVCCRACFKILLTLQQNLDKVWIELYTGRYMYVEITKYLINNLSVLYYANISTVGPFLTLNITLIIYNITVNSYTNFLIIFRINTIYSDIFYTLQHREAEKELVY